MAHWEKSKTKEQKETEKLGKIGRAMFDWTEDIVFAICLATIFLTFCFRIITVEGASMAPNYNEGDMVLATSFSINVKQGDVIIVNNTGSKLGPIIKRVVATQGQKVEFDNEKGTVLIDGKVLDESQYGIEDGITEISWDNYEALTFPATVPEGCVFVLGDNRRISKDSRYSDVGMIDERKILGKAMIKVFPFNDVGSAK